MIEFEYSREEDVVYVHRTGEVRSQDLLEYINRLDSCCESLHRLFIIDDMRNSESVFDSSDYPMVVREIEKKMKGYKEVRHAVLVNSPSDTVLSILFEMISQSVDNYFNKTFSTPAAARFWLK